MIPDWFPDNPPIYDIELSYLDNLTHGPFFSGPIPKRTLPPKEQWIDFLGHPVATPLAVPAGPLLSSNWTTLAAKLGFDIVIYKTIRSQEHPAHPLPNMLYVDTKAAPPAVKTATPSAMSDLAVTNSFGMPSMSPAFLREDIPRAKAALGPGQVLVVSVSATPGPGKSFIEDFVDTARLAVDAGAPIIEANFSCPNVDAKDGILYNNPDTVYAFGKQLADAIAPVPLIIKVGVFSTPELMRRVFVEAARAGIRAISGINTISMPVIDSAGKPALSETRKTSGICGNPIRDAALQFTRDGRAIIDEEKLDLTLLGGGGITLPNHFDLFLDAGADVAQTATGMMWDPYLAMRYHESKGYVTSD